MDRVDRARFAKAIQQLIDDHAIVDEDERSLDGELCVSVLDSPESAVAGRPDPGELGRLFLIALEREGFEVRRA